MESHTNWQVKLIEANDDTLEFEGAFVARDEWGNLVPHCFFSGIECELGTKPSPLEIGFAACWPLDARLLENWPLTVTLWHDDNPIPDVRANCTGNPAAVAAVKKFLTLIERNQAEVGMML